MKTTVMGEGVRGGMRESKKKVKSVQDSKFNLTNTNLIRKEEPKSFNFFFV
jgi:hypothetical protein